LDDSFASRIEDILSKKTGKKVTDPKFRSLPRAAVAVILSPDPLTKELATLLVKRVSKEKDPWSGQMAFPGGRSHGSDSNVFETVLREVLEETSIDLTKCKLLGTLDEIMPSSSLSIIVTPFVFSAAQEDILVKLQEEELETFVWVPISFFLRKENEAKSTVKPAGRDPLQVPSYLVLGQHIVWGLTFRIIRDLLEKIGDAVPVI
jgi:8-oxo-dGTP pyrophosphatase MutT (NUDIX family)